MVFCLFGICWVMPQRVVDLLDFWSCNYRWHCNIDIWSIVPHCLTWCIWREWNARSFERWERFILEFKSFVFFTFLEWCLVLPSFSCLPLLVFLDLCNLVSWCFCPFSTFPMYWAVLFFFFDKIFMSLIKKKKKKFHKPTLHGPLTDLVHQLSHTHSYFTSITCLQRASFSIPNLYSHFPSKASLKSLTFLITKPPKEMG